MSPQLGSEFLEEKVYISQVSTRGPESVESMY